MSPAREELNVIFDSKYPFRLVRTKKILSLQKNFIKSNFGVYF